MDAFILTPRAVRPHLVYCSFWPLLARLRTGNITKLETNHPAAKAASFFGPSHFLSWGQSR